MENYHITNCKRCKKEIRTGKIYKIESGEFCQECYFIRWREINKGSEEEGCMICGKEGKKYICLSCLQKEK